MPGRRPPSQNSLLRMVKRMYTPPVNISRNKTAFHSSGEIDHDASRSSDVVTRDFLSGSADDAGLEQSG